MIAQLATRPARHAIRWLIGTGRTGFGSMLLAGICCVLTLGCNDREQIPVYPVHGRVLLNGKPLADAIVSFHTQEGGMSGTYPSAHTDPDGQFAMTTYEHGDGAAQGSYSISIVCFRSRPLRKGQEGRAQNIVPYRYASPEASGLVATVSPGNNDLPPINLKSP
jgi:hypothetical protein